MNTSGANVYTDFSSFGNLRAEARSGSVEGKRAAAEQIEAMFLGMMLKSMRAAGGSMLEGPGAKVREEMFDSQLALNLAKNSKLGFADFMMHEFKRQQGSVVGSVTESNPIGAPGQIPPRSFATGLWGRPVSANDMALLPRQPSSTGPHNTPAPTPEISPVDSNLESKLA